MFLIVGALTPLVGLGLLVEQVLIIAYTSWYKGWNLLNPDGSYNGGYEYNVALGLLGLLFFVHGRRRLRDRPAVPAEEDRRRRGRPTTDTALPRALSRLARQSAIHR